MRYFLSLGWDGTLSEGTFWPALICGYVLT